MQTEINCKTNLHLLLQVELLNKQVQKTKMMYSHRWSLLQKQKREYTSSLQNQLAFDDSRKNILWDELEEKKHIKRNHARFIKTIALNDAIPRKSSTKCKKLNNKINEEMKCIFKCQNGCLLPARFCNNYAVSSLASGVWGLPLQSSKSAKLKFLIQYSFFYTPPPPHPTSPATRSSKSLQLKNVRGQWPEVAIPKNENGCWARLKSKYIEYTS